MGDLASNRCLNTVKSLKSFAPNGHQYGEGTIIGAHSAGEIPVPIPNTEVKPSSADYTALRETRKVPNYAVDFS